MQHFFLKAVTVLPMSGEKTTTGTLVFGSNSIASAETEKPQKSTVSGRLSAKSAEEALLSSPLRTLKTARSAIPSHFLQPAGMASAAAGTSGEENQDSLFRPANKKEKIEAQKTQGFERFDDQDALSTLTGAVVVPPMVRRETPLLSPSVNVEHLGAFRPRSLSIPSLFDDVNEAVRADVAQENAASAAKNSFFSGSESSVVWARKMNVQRPLNERIEDLGEIARGGFGFIHAVLDKTLRRKVAMKILDPQIVEQDPDAAARFIEEAQITGQLDHPNIVPVHEAGVDENGRNYFTMKMVKGKTLTSIFEGMRDQAITKGDVDHVLKILVKVCEALEFAHAHGVVHRDIKPDNIMVGSHGQVYLMDWGICRMRHSSNSSQQVSLSPQAITGGDEEGTIMGSPAYMAPEQACGKIAETDGQSDVFCLGACLYQFLTGIPPYNEATAIEAVKKAQVADFCSPEDFPHGAALPPELVRICLTMMAAEKSERYASVAALRIDLERFLTGGWWFATKRHERGVVIIEQGDEGQEAFIIVKGTCEVFRMENGRKTSLGELGPGDVFGEMALLTEKPRSASVRAITPLEVMIITQEDLKAQQSQDSWLASFARSMAARFREVDQRYHAAKRAPRDQAVVNRILERMIFDGIPSGKEQRWLSYAQVLPLLCAELSRNKEEILRAIDCNERLSVDHAQGRIVLTRGGNNVLKAFD